MESPLLLIDLPPRETAPPSFVRRMQQRPQFKTVEPKDRFFTDFAKFQENASEFEVEASEYLYDNSQAGEHEYRVHCHLLGCLIADAQTLILFVLSNQLQGVEAEKMFLESKVQLYIATLTEWHGGPGSHKDEPPRFGKAMREADAGEVIDGPI